MRIAGRMYALTTVVLVRSYSFISGNTSHDAVTSNSGNSFSLIFFAASSCTGLT